MTAETDPGCVKTLSEGKIELSTNGAIHERLY